jgi:DNA-binding transcriptional LysR family regulator
MLITFMRLEKLHQLDLNLLITLAVIAEEKSVTEAAVRLRLSQPAVSRALQRARRMFDDDLLVRSAAGFEPTLRGRKILDQLNQLLPEMEALVTPSAFDPKKERSNFRIAGPDNVCSVVLPRLCRRYANGRYRVSFEFVPYQAGVAEQLEHGKLDLALTHDQGLLPAHLQSQEFYEEEWICVVARESRFGDRLSLKQYVVAEHLVVATLPGVQSIPDKQMGALGLKRRSSVRMPYFGVAINCLPGTELVLTLTSGMRESVERDARLRIVNAPQELKPFHFVMIWHPRLNTDARHAWLRAAILRTAHMEAKP